MHKVDHCNNTVDSEIVHLQAPVGPLGADQAAVHMDSHAVDRFALQAPEADFPSCSHVSYGADAQSSNRITSGTYFLEDEHTPLEDLRHDLLGFEHVEDPFSHGFSLE